MVFYHYDRLSALSPGQKVELSRDYCKLGSQAEGVSVVLSEMFPEGLSMHGYHYLDVFVSENRWAMLYASCRRSRSNGIWSLFGAHCIQSCLRDANPSSV